jgi:FHA domain/IPT/TIG domain
MATSWHLTSLTVLGGTLHGKKLTIEDVVVEVLIGSDPDCHLHLDLPSVSPIHARLWIEPDDVTVYGTRSGPGVFVNFDRIEVDGKLRPGDLLWLGPPQAAGSVMLQVQFEERDTLPPVAATAPADEEMDGAQESEATAAAPLALELSALTEPLAASAPAESDATSKPPIPIDEEPLGVLPEDAPTPLRLALEPEAHPEPEPVPPLSSGAMSEPLAGEPSMGDLNSVGPSVVAMDAPPQEFEDFLVMDAGFSVPQVPAAAAEEFVVAAFEPEWPEAPEPHEPQRTAPPPVPVPLVPVLRPGPDPAEGDDLFFIDASAPPPPAGVASESDDSFFIDDGSLGSGPGVVPMPMPISVPGPAAELHDLSFAAAFLEEPPPKSVPPLPAIAPTPPPVVRPVTPPAKPAPTRVASAPPAVKPSPAASQAVPSAALPPRSPSASSAVRPLSRPDTSQSLARGEHPTASRPDRSQGVRPRRPPPRPVGRYAVIGVVALLVVGGIAFATLTLMHRVRVEKIEPQRARVGDTVAIVGRGFAASPADNVVLFDDKAGRVSTATPTRLEVVVPDVATMGADGHPAVRVRVGRSESQPVELAVYSGPVLHGISPDVAMPGDEVVLAGTGWGLGPTVRFGGLPGEVLEARETSIRVRVPAIDGGPGTAAPVVVISGSLESNAGPFYVGHIPLVTKAEPSSVSPGEVVTLSGRGFRREPSQNTVQIGGVRALVVSAFDSEIKVIVPRVPPGSRTLEVRVPSSVAPAQVPLVVGGAPGALEFHFVAEPFDAMPGRDHAVLATALGPAFVLASSGGRPAAERALETSRRLNQAAESLKASPELTFDLRDAGSKPSLGLVGRPELMIEVTEEDAGAYGEDWTGLHGRGGPVTASRLGLWWEAVAKDLVLLLVRGQRPHFAADLAPEGRGLVDLFQSVQRGGPGTAKTPARDALRLVALRVPPGVRGPAMVVAASPIPSPGAPATPSPSSAQPMPRLEGSWTGSESEGGRQRFVTVTFRGSTGTIAYEGVVTVSAPLLSVEQPQRGAARFSVELRGGLRYYVGRWDGQALTGKISTDPGASQAIGTFELRPR